jgi:hypothetical protein
VPQAAEQAVHDPVEAVSGFRHAGIRPAGPSAGNFSFPHPDLKLAGANSAPGPRPAFDLPQFIEKTRGAAARDKRTKHVTGVTDMKRI